jgi:hypothetical protein
MKMLARANVPTVEAGTFPSLRSQQAPRPAPAYPVDPDESASQVGIGTAASRSRASNVGRPPRVGLSVMAPPQIYVNDHNNRDYRAPGQVSTTRGLAADQLMPPQPAYPKSNLSLSTATTLVPGKHDRTLHTSHTQSSFGAYPYQTANVYNELPQCDVPAGSQLPRTRRPRQEDPYTLPPSRQGLTADPHEQRVATQHLPAHVVGSRASTNQNAFGGSQGYTAQANEPVQSPKPAPKGKRKRAAAPTSKATSIAKKPRAAPVAKKKGKLAQKEPAVPNDEELLQQPGSAMLSGVLSAARNLATAPQQLDNKSGTSIQGPAEGLEIAESVANAETNDTASIELGQPGPTPTSRRMTRAMSRALSSIPQQCSISAQTGVSRRKATPPPCTPADQIIDTTAPPALPTAHGHSPTSKPTTVAAARTPSFQLPSINCEAPPPATDAGPSNTAPTPPSAKITDPLLALAQQCMTADSNFDLSNSSTRLAAWNSLPSATRVTALRQHFCNLIMNDDFVELVRGISQCWEGAILEGRMMRFVPGDGSRDEEVEPGSANENESGIVD